MKELLSIESGTISDGMSVGESVPSDKLGELIKEVTELCEHDYPSCYEFRTGSAPNSKRKYMRIFIEMMDEGMACGKGKDGAYETVDFIDNLPSGRHKAEFRLLDCVTLAFLQLLMPFHGKHGTVNVGIDEDGVVGIVAYLWI